MSLCTCQSSKEFDQCCQPLLAQQRAAVNPEELMRSRYSAFCAKDLDYIMNTTDPQARADMDFAATEEWMNGAQFINLEILRASDEGNKGIVEFKAHYRMNDQDHVHHEISKFRKQSGVWYFRDGKVVPSN